jgi:hypothetical protein
LDIDIEPCPFCGGEGLRNARRFWDMDVADVAGIKKHGGDLSIAADSFGWYWVEYIACNATGPRIKGACGNNAYQHPEKVVEAAKKVVDKWNKRAQKSQMRLELN